MNTNQIIPPTFTGASRRRFIHQLGLGAALFTVRGAFAEALARQTAWVEEGPFYPPKLPLDTDNDLIIVNDSITPAVGEITHLSGRLLDPKGDPIRNATLEIWEVDSTAVYLADRPNQTKFDANFQGFGRFLTGSTGEYYFRTIKPVRYPGRQAPHIHFKVKMKGREAWTTQLYIKGDPGNAQDGVFQGIGDNQAQETVTVDFAPLKGSEIGELAAKFDIVLGRTPQEDEHGNLRGGRRGRGGPGQRGGPPGGGRPGPPPGEGGGGY
jgi:protocatechuate 3,4-dioxygenase beta subunit